MFYIWPVKPFRRTQARLGTLGEFRGQGTNDITRLHSGMDIAVSGGLVEVFSPDVGLVRRFTVAATQNPSGGGGPVRIGHWAFNHIRTVFVTPGTNQGGVRLPQNLPIYVEDRGFTYYVPRAGVANPQNDGDFRGLQLRGRPIVAYRKNGPNNYSNVSIWPRTLPIGRGVQPTDLHCFYYGTADGPVADGASIRNALEVLDNYRNRVDPLADALRMYTQAGDRLMLDLAQQGASVVHRPAMGGAKFKLWAFSPFNSRCGVYQIDYEILNHLGNTTGRLNSWTFQRLPPDNRSFDLVDPQLSQFNTVNDKFTVYIITNSRNGNINNTFHWEVENPAMWPDGCYAIKVWIYNIRRSQGEGKAPDLNEVLYGAEFKVDTDQQGTNRRIIVTQGFRKRAADWQPAFRECDGPKRKRGRREEEKTRTKR